MQYKKFGNTELKVSEFALGTIIFGTTDFHGLSTNINQENANNR